MPHVCRILLGSLFLGLVMPWLALADAEIDEGEAVRARLNKLLENPEQRARLLHNVHHFQNLSVDQQYRLRQLDKELREVDSKESARLQRVLERYASWLRNLPESERQRVVAASTAQERLKLIRELREQQWIERLPRSQRDSLLVLALEQRSPQVAQLRREERERRDEWRTAFRNWGQLMHKRPPIEVLNELWPDVEVYVRETLTPMLTADEKQMLATARMAKRPAQAKLFVTLADRHPVRLPGPSTGPAKFDDLPKAVRDAFPELKDQPPSEVRIAQGKWPDYAIAVTQFSRRQGNRTIPKQLGPARPIEFSKATQEFLEGVLRPRLDAAEKVELFYAAGSWPRYPMLINQYSRKYGLQVPGQALPGPREVWDAIRAMKLPAAGDIAEGSRAAFLKDPLPDVPDPTLHEFMRRELSSEDRAQLPSMSLADPANRERIQELYFQRYPEERRRLWQADKKKAKNRKGG